MAVIKSAGDISDISTCAANTTATGPGITTANPGRTAIFTITSHDSRNFQRKRGGDVFVVKLKPEMGGGEIKVELMDRKDGTYLAEYTVDKMYGKLTLSVCLRGAHIKGSPFAVNVKPLICSNSPEIQGAVLSSRSNYSGMQGALRSSRSNPPEIQGAVRSSRSTSRMADYFSSQKNNHS